jgi:glycosyltransferase involved in cell wall biosynthesis
VTPRPLVSVVMSVFNDRPEYLSLAADSILRQTYDNLELLIMDDGSGPETAGALDALTRRDERIRLFRQENAGLPKALNRLIRRAQGRFIARQDGDDISEPERLERQVSFLNRHPQVMLLGTGCLLIDVRGNILLRQRLETRPAALRHRLCQRNQFVHGSVMFRAEIFRHFQYQEECRYAQDYELFLRIAERHAVANLDLPLYRYRLNANSISEKKAFEQQWMAMIISEVARRRRLGEALPWSASSYTRLAASLDTSGQRRRLKFTMFSVQGRNFLLAGNKAEARQMFWRALLLHPGPRGFWRLWRALLPGRHVK